MNNLKKVGRPKETNPHNQRFEVRLTDEQYKMLKECSDKANIRKSEVVTKGIEMFYISLIDNKKLSG